MASDRESLLQRLASLAASAGATEIADQARALADRVAEGRFYLACVGQFKRGKSTILDALIGDAILPVGVLPVTSLPTVVRFGPDRSARVLVRGSEWQYVDPATLADYVSEQENPLNEKHVLAVEVFVPCELLATGMCLVDTPGIGSVFEANTMKTQEFVPHIDAALVVLGVDPPISGDELTLSTKISREVEDVLFVINKADRVSGEELSAAKQFARRVLGNRLGRPIEIYEISAREQLDGAHGTRDWTALLGALEQMASSSARRLTWLAQQRGASRLVAWLRNTIAEEKRALLEPIQESESRIRQLTEFTAQSQQAISDLSLLFTGEQQRAFRSLEERRRHFIADILPQATRELHQRLKVSPSYGPVQRRFVMNTAMDIARAYVFPWLEKEEQLAVGEYVRLTDRFKSLTNNFLQKLSAAAEPALEHISDSMVEWSGSSSPSRFQFNKLLDVARPASPLRYAADVILGGIGLTRLIRQDAEQFLLRLIDTNTSRVQSDLNERLAVSRNRLESRVREVLRTADAVAERSLARARTTKQSGEIAVQERLVALSGLETAIHELSQQIATAQTPLLPIP